MNKKKKIGYILVTLLMMGLFGITGCDKQEDKETNFISLSDCYGTNDYVKEKIDTFYFDSDGMANKKTITNYMQDKDSAKEYYQIIQKDSRYTNVKLIKEIIVQYDLTDEQFNKLYPNKHDKEFLINYYESTCDLVCENGECHWGNEKSQSSNFDPASIS